MKRLNDVFEQIIDKKTLTISHMRAKKGKHWYKEVKQVDNDLKFYIDSLHHLLKSGNYKTSEYKIKTIKDRGKERVIHVLPYYPDRIVHHAVMMICGDKWEKSLIRDTFQSLKGRGTSDARKRIRSYIDNHKPNYYLQIDVSKYYPSIPNEGMKRVIRKTIKCKPTLKLIEEIIDSTKGVPIGNYLSQIFGNLYLSEFDWWIKQDKGVKAYYRYCDDIVILHDDKNYLHQLRKDIETKLSEYELKIKPCWKVSDLYNTGLDFIGYVFTLNNTRLRKKIKQNFVRSSENSHSSYWGWIKPLKKQSLWYSKIGL